MKVEHILEHFGRLVLCAVGGWALACPLSGQAANTNVDISNTANALSFFPPAVTINVGDKVTWTWKGILGHSTTDSGVWDSGITNASATITPTFSFTFNSAGSFPYVCVPHSFFGMAGSVTVQAGNALPSVAINSPTNGATFAAPWSGTIQAAVSDSDGTVSKVDFFADTTHLGTVNNPPANATFTVTSLAAGNHTLKAVATDNGGATNTSAGVSIAVVTPVPIVLSAPQLMSASAVQFEYSANPGLSYIVLRSGILPTFSPISTNTATSNTVTYLDNSASGQMNFYRVQLAPNP